MEEKQALTEEQRLLQERSAEKTRRVFFLFLIGIAAVGCLFVALALVRPHRTGVVTRVGRVSQYTVHTGTGRHRAGHKRYSANVRVQVKDTREQETVYYRVRDLDMIPQVGDEVAFSYSLLIGGNSPYPELWAVWIGVALLLMDGLALAGYLAAVRRKQAREYAEELAREAGERA